jgi:signal transduction histidine kinase
MSSVALSDIPRTTSFRLALLFLGLFGASSLILFGFMYWQTAGYVSGGLDYWLRNEMASRLAMHSGDRLRDLQARTKLDPDGRRPLALFSADRQWLAGEPASLPTPLPPLDQPVEFTMPHRGKAVPFRGMVHRLGNGDILLVAEDLGDIHRFRDLLLGAMASGGLVVVVLGLTGAAIVGAVALGRIDGVTRAIERVVDGDLSERLPSNGTGGDINRLIQVVNRMLDEIERLMHEVKGITDEIAHDLRTPLTRLLAGLERARRRAHSTDEYGAAVEQAIADTRGILTTFGALLRIAEVEGGARRAGFVLLDLNTVAADVADFYEPLAERKGITLALETTATPAEMPGDPNLLFEAIGNLVDNAIKFTPANGSVVLRIIARDDGLGFEVCDSGPGIPEAERNAVLQRFHRVDKSRHAPGCGLGLSLVAAVAKLHLLHLVIEDVAPGCRVRLWRDEVGEKRHSLTLGASAHRAC